MSLDQKAIELIEERWRVLQVCARRRGKMSSYGREISAFEDFSGTAKQLLTDSRWPAAFQITRGSQALWQHGRRLRLRARPQRPDAGRGARATSTSASTAGTTTSNLGSDHETITTS